MSRSTSLARTHPQRSAHDALQHVTAEITRLLEQGVMPWRALWDAAHAEALSSPGLPLRSTGEPYRGMNVVLLWAAQMARGYPKRTWITFRQALALGAHVRKGEKACPVIYYGVATPKDKVSGEDAANECDEHARSHRFLKLFHVFNLAQIEDLPPDFGIEPEAPAARGSRAMEDWVRRAGAEIRIGGAEAFYSPVVDAIHMPPLEAFREPDVFDAVLGHEAIHFTGHKSRLDRLGDYHTDKKARAKEELTAEIGAAVLGAMIGFKPEHIEDHAAYIGYWLDFLRSEPRAFFAAAAKAQAAVDWLIERAGSPLASDLG